MFGALQLGLGLTRRQGGGAFSPLSILSANDVWWDFRQTDRTWQEATGLTPADEDSELVGLALDSSQWGGKTYAALLASLAELIDATVGVAGAATVNRGTQTLLSARKWRLETTSLAGAAGWATGSINPLMENGGTYETAVIRSARSVTNAGAAVALYRSQALNSGVEGVSQFTGTGLGTTRGVVTGTATLDTLTLSAAGGAAAVVGDTWDLEVSVKKIPTKQAAQTTSGNRPQRKGGGFLRFNPANSENLLTQWGPSTSGSLFARVAVAASISALQVIAGGTVGTTRCFLGINTSGQLCAGIGSDAETTIVGMTDLRGTTANVAVTWDATDGVRLYVDGIEEYSGAKNGTTGTNPLRIGASNNAGTAANFFDGDIYTLLGFDDAVAAADILRLHSWASSSF